MASDVVAEPEHLLLAGHRREGAVGVDVGDEEVEGVRSEIERGDAHWLHANDSVTAKGARDTSAA